MGDITKTKEVIMYACPLCHPAPNIIVGVLGLVVFGYGWMMVAGSPYVPAHLIHTAFSLLMLMSSFILWFGVSQIKRRKCHS